MPEKNVVIFEEFLNDIKNHFCPEPSREELEKFAKNFRIFYENGNVYPVETMPARKDCCLYRDDDGIYCDQIGDGSQSISLDKGCVKNCILYHKKHKVE